MAHAETVAKGKCACCGGQVAVKLNRSKLAYYRCDDCGAEVRHHWQRTSDKFMRRFARFAAPEDAAPAANNGESRPAEAKKPAAGGGLAALFG